MNRKPFNLGILFYDIASNYKKSVALKYPDDNFYCFEELNNLSNQIARYLNNQAIKKNNVVVIFNDKSPNSYASMIACLKIGAIYCNIDISSPFARAEKMINKINPSIILCDNIDKSLYFC